MAVKAMLGNSDSTVTCKLLRQELASRSGVADNPTRLRSSLYGSKRFTNSFTAELEFRVRIPDGREIIEYVAGSGDSLEKAENDAKVNFILSTFCLVWAADIAAYFGGRAFGKRKLAPGISPGKSWEGVWSGMLGALALAAFWLWLDTMFKMDSLSLYLRLYARFGAIGLIGSALSRRRRKA